VPDAGLMRTRWVVSGSRLLQNHRAAILESGSPPTRPLSGYKLTVFISHPLNAQRFCVTRHRRRPRPRIRPHQSDGVLEYCAKSELHPASAGLEMLKVEMEQSLLCVSLNPSYVFEGK
jgi:hypothetical protein